MDILTGINTGIIQSQQGVLAIVLKATCASGTEHLLYLPPDQLQELIFAVSACYRTLLEKYEAEPEIIKEQVMAATQALSVNAPCVTDDEAHNPRPELRVVNLVLKPRQDNNTFLFFLQNEEVVSIGLMPSQIEYLLNMLLMTIQTAADPQLIAMIAEMNDFIPLYTVSFGSSAEQGINYNQFDVPEWKSAMFDCFYSILFIQKDGGIPCGTIIKSGDTLAPSRVEKISNLLLQRNTLLSSCSEQQTEIDYTRLDISENDPGMDSLLRAHLKHRSMKLN